MLAIPLGPAASPFPVSSGAIPTSLIVSPVRRNPQRMPRRGSCPDAPFPDVGAISPPVISGLPDEAGSWCGSTNLCPGRRRTDAEIRLCQRLWRSSNDGKDCRRDELGDVPHSDLPSPREAAKHLPAFDWPFLRRPELQNATMLGAGRIWARTPRDAARLAPCPHVLRLVSSRPCSFSAGTRSPLTPADGRTS